MRLACVLAFAFAAAGCAPRGGSGPRTPDGPLADADVLYEAFLADAPAAERRYGKRVRFQMTVVAVERGIGGEWVAVGRLRREHDGGRAKVRASFRNDQRDRLAGLAAQDIIGHGVVTGADRLGLWLADCVRD